MRITSAHFLVYFFLYKKNIKVPHQDKAVENRPLPCPPYPSHGARRPQLLRLLPNEPLECMYTRMQMEIPAGTAKDRAAGGGAQDGTADRGVREGNTNK